MKKTLIFMLALLLSISLFGCGVKGDQLQNGGQLEEKQQSYTSDEAAIAGLVKHFGSKLQTVSLQAPADIVKKSMQENYSDCVSPDLLAKWQNDPENAPGRMVSSPWPDRIEILTIEKKSEDEYEVKGEIIEITSAEQVKGGVAAKRPITLVVKKTENRWLIDDFMLGTYVEQFKDNFYNSVNYDPAKDLLSFTIPETIPENHKFYLHVSGRSYMGDKSYGMSLHAFDEESENFSWENGKTYTYSLKSENLDNCMLVYGLINKNNQELLYTIYISPDGTKSINS